MILKIAKNLEKTAKKKSVLVAAAKGALKGYLTAAGAAAIPSVLHSSSKIIKNPNKSAEISGKHKIVGEEIKADSHPKAKLVNKAQLALTTLGAARDAYKQYKKNKEEDKKEKNKK